MVGMILVMRVEGEVGVQQVKVASHRVDLVEDALLDDLIDVLAVNLASEGVA